jgi:restriction system protein
MAKKKVAKKKSVVKAKRGVKKAKVSPLTIKGNSCKWRKESGTQRKGRSKAHDKVVSALRGRYQERLMSELSPGSLNAEKVREAFAGVEGICESIAIEGNLANREGMIRAAQAAFFGAAEIESGRKRVMELLAAFISERVALARVGRRAASPANESRPKTGPVKSEKGHPAQHDDQALSDLRADFLERIMEVQRPGPCQQREDTHRFLISLDRTCDSLLQNQTPQRREATLRETQAAFRYITEQNPTSKSFIGLLTSYIRERVTLRIQSEPTFSDDAPRIAIRSLIIPGDTTKEGTLVKGVSALWFQIMRMIQADPDSIHHIDCWKWEELLAGAYKQDGWETVVLTPKRGDHGIDVIAERKGWGQLRFLLLDQMKAYKPGHLIGPDEIREMKGVLLDHPEASKGLITTTADFTPGALEAASNLVPRLELRPREKLVEWLASVAVENLRAGGASEAGGTNDG